MNESVAMEVTQEMQNMIFLRRNSVSFSQQTWLLNVRLSLSPHIRHVNELQAALERIKESQKAFHFVVSQSYGELRDNSMGGDVLPFIMSEDENLNNELNFIGQRLKSLEADLSQIESIFFNLDYDRERELRKARKRRWVGLVGSILGLYNMASLSDLKAQVNIVQDRTNEILTNQNQLFMMIHTSTELTERNSENIETLGAHVENLAEMFANQIQELAQRSMYLQQLTMTNSVLRSNVNLLLAMVDEVASQIVQLQHQLTHAIFGQFDTSILAWDNLTATIDQINRNLPQGKQLIFSRENVRQNLQTPVIIFSINQSIYISLSFPIEDRRSQRYDIFAIKNMPIIMDDTSIGRVKLDPTIKGIAVSEKRNSFRLLSENDLQSCSMNHLQSCHEQTYEFQTVTNANCVTAYFQFSENNIKKFCTIETLDKPPKVEIAQLSGTTFAIFTHEERFLQGRCAVGSASQQGDVHLRPGTSMVTVTPDCQLSDRDFVLYGNSQVSSILDSTKDIGKQIERFTETIGVLNFTEFRMAEKILLPELMLKDTRKLRESMKKRLNGYNQRMQQLEKGSTGYKWYLVLAAGLVLLALIIIGVIVISFWYKKNMTPLKLLSKMGDLPEWGKSLMDTVVQLDASTSKPNTTLRRSPQEDMKSAFQTIEQRLQKSLESLNDYALKHKEQQYRNENEPVNSTSMPNLGAGQYGNIGCATGGRCPTAPNPSPATHYPMNIANSPYQHANSLLHNMKKAQSAIHLNENAGGIDYQQISRKVTFEEPDTENVDRGGGYTPYFPKGSYK